MTVATPTDSLAWADHEETPPGRPVYLDCNATTPVEPRVAFEVVKYMLEEFGNAGSRTHGYGQTARERINRARGEVAAVVDARPEEVIFTSGSTDRNNLAILGLASHGEATGRRHIISSQIEHKAVLEPLQSLAGRGFEVTLLPPTTGGWVDPSAVRDALRPDTILVSIMAANNETGVVQPIEEIVDVLSEHDAYLHVDAAQAFGKLISMLRLKRIDLVSVSGHKLFAPKGVGALIARRRGYTRPPLTPLMHGGGQERGLRPGTLPVHLVAGLGLASTLAMQEHLERAEQCAVIKRDALKALEPLGILLNGDADRTMEHTLNFSVPGVDSEAAIVALKDIVAVSNGSACTAQNYEPSHVLAAAQLPAARVSGALRLSWSHRTEQVDWADVRVRLQQLSGI